MRAALAVVPGTCASAGAKPAGAVVLRGGGGDGNDANSPDSKAYLRERA